MLPNAAELRAETEAKLAAEAEAKLKAERDFEASLPERKNAQVQRVLEDATEAIMNCHKIQKTFTTVYGRTLLAGVKDAIVEDIKKNGFDVRTEEARKEELDYEYGNGTGEYYWQTTFHISW